MNDATRICPVCSKPHNIPAYAGCCSRGCMRYHARRNAPLAKRLPNPSPLARELVAAVIETKPRPMIRVDPPPHIETLARCSVCQKKSPDWTVFVIDGKNVCCICRPAYVVRKTVSDDRARPDAPSMGGGVRVIRSTRGLS